MNILELFDCIPKSLKSTFGFSTDSFDNSCCCSNSLDQLNSSDQLDGPKDFTINSLDYDIPRKLQRGDLIKIQNSINTEVIGKHGRIYSIRSSDCVLVKLVPSKTKEKEADITYTFASNELVCVTPLYQGYFYILSSDTLFRKWKKKYFEIRDNEFNYRDDELSPEIKFSVEISSCTLEDVENELELPGSVLPSKLSLKYVKSLSYFDNLMYLCFLNEVDTVKVGQLMSRIIFKSPNE